MTLNSSTPSSTLSRRLQTFATVLSYMVLGVQHSRASCMLNQHSELSDIPTLQRIFWNDLECLADLVPDFGWCSDFAPCVVRMLSRAQGLRIVSPKEGTAHHATSSPFILYFLFPQRF